MFAHELAIAVNEMPEVVAVQTYAGTAQPFNFNGMVRHYYLRQQPWQGDLLVQLLDKDDREKSSHQIAEEARALLTPIAKSSGCAYCDCRNAAWATCITDCSCGNPWS